MALKSGVFSSVVCCLCVLLPPAGRPSELQLLSLRGRLLSVVLDSHPVFLQLIVD